ncbi:MAG: radical SAM protein [Thermodesulfobacteria bacterium]|nr:radical SAM protein [Thermodesulfobacteriota bacterium]
MYIQRFDPWKSKLCTCPEKYSLNPYTGCGHRCLYCYATAFIKNFYSPRPKKNFIKKVKSELQKIPPGSLISLSNSSDPYQPLEKTYFHTRNFLELLESKNFKLLIITKSDLVLRDLPILKNLNCVVSITITTKKYFRILEPGAPSYEKRLYAIKTLSKAGILVTARIDPVIPFLNDEEVIKIFEEVAPWVKHITTSTYKAKRDSFARLKKAFPEKAKLWQELYFVKGKKIEGAWYLPEDLRKELLYPLFEKAKEFGISIAACREGIKEFSAKEKCDGSFLIDKFLFNELKE